MAFLFTSERLGFREMTEADLNSLQDLNTDPQVMEFFPALYSEEQTLAGIRRNMSNYKSVGYGMWIAEVKNSQEFIGFIGLAPVNFDAPFCPATEIGWRLIKKVWNQGFATEGALRCLEYGFDTLNLDKIVSFTAKINGPSERVMQKIGMRKSAEFMHPKLSENDRLNPHVLYEIGPDSF